MSLKTKKKRKEKAKNASRLKRRIIQREKERKLAAVLNRPFGALQVPGRP